MTFNLFAEGLLPPDVSQGHRDLVLKLFFNWSKITGIFYIYMLVHHGLRYNRLFLSLLSLFPRFRTFSPITALPYIYSGEYYISPSEPLALD